MASFTLHTARSINYIVVLWHTLLYGSLLYNFHRYIFKYSHGGYPKDGYQQTPLLWQAGKFAITIAILLMIYINTRFFSRISIYLILIYSFLFVVCLTNIFSILIYHQIVTDEIEYLLFAFMLLPLGFSSNEDLTKIGNEISNILNVSQYIIIFSNWVVIFNYFVFGIVPFHAYEGILLRFGGLWDDPNTLAIISALLLGYSVFNRQYILSTFHVINILLTISFNGYLLLLFTIVYFFLNSKSNRFGRLIILCALLGLVILVAFINFELIMPIYEAKRESVEQHSTLDVDFHWLPLLEPIQFHETWWISLIVNYFPLSVGAVIVSIWIFIRTLFLEPKSLQGLMFILFFVTNLFLPFLYMFPVNFIALLFLVLYTKGIKF